MQAFVPPEIESYCSHHSGEGDSLLDELEEYTQRHCAAPQMLIGPYEGALLAMLARLIGAHRALEIGTFTGYSALSLAEGLTGDGELITCDINPETSAIAQSYFDRSPHHRKIKLRLGPALETLATLAPPFDLVFIDADKGNYINYFETCLPLLRQGGLIIADNVLWSGRVLKPKDRDDHAIVAFNEKIRRDARVECVMLPIRDGVSMIRKR